jgi:hypothetical protein
VNLRKNPKIGYDSCPPLYNAYDRKSHKRFLIVSLVKKKKEKITNLPYQEMMNSFENI